VASTEAKHGAPLTTRRNPQTQRKQQHLIEYSIGEGDRGRALERSPNCVPLIPARTAAPIAAPMAAEPTRCRFRRTKANSS